MCLAGLAKDYITLAQHASCAYCVSDRDAILLATSQAFVNKLLLFTNDRSHKYGIAYWSSITVEEHSIKFSSGNGTGWNSIFMDRKSWGELEVRNIRRRIFAGPKGRCAALQLHLEIRIPVGTPFPPAELHHAHLSGRRPRADPKYAHINQLRWVHPGKPQGRAKRGGKCSN